MRGRAPNIALTRVVTGSALGAPRFPGEVVIYAADPANGVEWLFRHSGDGSAYPWRCIGGMPLTNEVSAGSVIVSASHVDPPTTAGPQITLPLAGDYEFRGEMDVSAGAASSTPSGIVALKFGGAATSDNDALFTFNSVINATGNVTQSTGGKGYVRTALAAGTVVKYQAKTTGSIWTIARRTLSVKPVRVA